MFSSLTQGTIFMLVTLQPISSQDHLTLEIQMLPACLCIHEHQESTTHHIQATHWYPSIHAAPCVTAQQIAVRLLSLVFVSFLLFRS